MTNEELKRTSDLVYEKLGEDVEIKSGRIEYEKVLTYIIEGKGYSITFKIDRYGLSKESLYDTVKAFFDKWETLKEDPK